MHTFFDFLQANLVLVVVFVLLLVTYLGLEILFSIDSESSVTLEKAIYAYNHEHALLVDLRSEEEYLFSHPVGSIHHLSLNTKLKGKAKKIILMAATDKAPTDWLKKLQVSGHDVSYLHGGIVTWFKASMPTVNKKG